MAAPDEALIDDLKAGRIDVFRTLYERHRDALLRVAGRILGNHADAEDAVHDVFLILFEKVGGFRGQSSFTTWLYRILVNACLQIRKKRKRTVVLDREPGLPARADSPEMNEAASTLSLEIDALPMRQKLVFHLAEVEGRSLKETADILGLKAGTVRHHFFKARERLRERLRPFIENSDLGVKQ